MSKRESCADARAQAVVTLQDLTPVSCLRRALICRGVQPTRWVDTTLGECQMEIWLIAG